MIAAGESLGTRYTASTAPEEPRAGALFEVIDRSSTVVFGQLLADVSVTPSQVAEVRAELSIIPALPALLRPRELVMSPRSLPVAILDRPGIVTLRNRAPALAESLGKRPLAVTLFRGIAAVAADLAVAHQAGAIHGAITSRVLLSNVRNDNEIVLLSGFGIQGFVQRNHPPPDAEPTKRKDLTDLLGALHDLFLVSGAQPVGSAAARWSLLRHSAMHGEHPALASGIALAATLNEIASLPDDTDAPPARRATLAPPARTTGTRTSNTGRYPQPSSSRKTTGDTHRAVRNSSERPSGATRPKFSMGIVGAGIAGILAVAGFVGFSIWKIQHDVSPGGTTAGPLVTHPPRLSPTVNALRCPGETTNPPAALSPEGPLQDFGGACSDGGGSPWLTVVARTGTTVTAALRQAVLGQRYGTTMTLGTGAVEFGSTLALSDATWVAWRNGVGVPIGLARVDGHGPLPVPVELTGWDSVPLRAANLLYASTRDVFVVSNVESEAGTHPVLFDIALAPLGSRPPVTTWFLGAGVVDSVIPGESPTVLLHAVGAGRHELSALTLHLGALAAAHPTSEPTSVRGSTLPDATVDRSQSLMVSAEALASAPHGAGSPPSFLISAGTARSNEPCLTPGRCANAGEVSLVVFAPGAAPTLRELAHHGWVEDLGPGDGNGLRAVLMLATPSGAPAGVYTEVSIASPTAAPVRAALMTLGSTRAALVHCGNTPWMIFDVSEPHPGVSTLPLSCMRAVR